MSIQMILLPVFVHVALTFVLMFAMGGARATAVRSGSVKTRDIALGEQAWPEQPTKFANCFANQFQAPVLFYVLVVLAIYTKQADLLFVLLSWVFVVLRILHAGIHVSTNYVPHRFYAFAAGAIVLLVMWVVFAFRILLAL